MSKPKLTNARVKYLVFLHYSKSNKPECTNCGFDNINALCLDHVEGDGFKHRKNKTNLKGTNLYRNLLRNNFECDYKLQVLCANCNMIKSIENKESSKPKSKEWKLKASQRLKDKKHPQGKEAYRSIPVEQYDLQGNYIKTWDYIKEAEAYYNTNTNAKNIVACCNNRQKTAYGFIWKHKK